MTPSIILNFHKTIFIIHIIFQFSKFPFDSTLSACFIFSKHPNDDKCARGNGFAFFGFDRFKRQSATFFPVNFALTNFLFSSSWEATTGVLIHKKTDWMAVFMPCFARNKKKREKTTTTKDAVVRIFSWGYCVTNIARLRG